MSMTLIEELTQAAEDADLLAEVQGSEHWRQRAGRLRARAEHVRKMLAAPAVATQLIVATGPIPAQESTDVRRPR